MSEQDVGLVIPILGDVSGIKESMGQVKNSVSEAMGGVKAAIGAAGIMAAGYLKGAIEAAAKGEESTARLKKLIENQGESWDKSKGKVDQFTKGIMNMSTYTGGQAKEALTILEQRGVKLNDALGMQNTLVNLAAGKNIELSEASNILADAYNGKTKALLSLGLATKDEIKNGINFSEVQKRINDRFGGEAAAQLNTYNGQLKQSQNYMNSIKGAIGGVLLPYFTQVAKKINEVAQSVSKFATEHKQVIAAVLSVTAVLGTLIGGTAIFQKILAVLGPAVTGITSLIGGLTLPIVAVIGAITALTFAYTKNFGGFKTLIDNMIKPVIESFKKMFEVIKKGESIGNAIYQGFANLLGSGVAGKIANAVDAVTFSIKGIVKFLKGDLAGAKNMFFYIFGEDDVKYEASAQKIVDVLVIVKNAISSVVSFVVSELSKMLQWVQANWPLIQQTVQTVLNFCWNIITTILGNIQSFWHNHGNTIITIVQNCWGIIKTVIDTTINVIGNLISFVMNVINGNWKAAWGDLVNAVKSIFGGAAQIIRDILNSIGAIFSDMVKTAWNWGANLINGFIDGIKSKVNAAKDAVHDVIKGAKDFIGFNSPAKEGEGRNITKWGANMIGGFMDGIKQQIPSLQALMNTVIQAPNYNAGIMPGGSGSNSYNSSKNVSFNISNLNVQNKGDQTRTLQQLDFLTAF